MSDGPFRIILVAPNSRLYEKLQAAMRQRTCSVPIIQVRSWNHGIAKIEMFPDSVLLIQCQSEEVPQLLPNFAELHHGSPNVTLAVFVPDLPKLPVSLGELLRFSILESGATMVLGSLRELPTLLTVAKRCESRMPCTRAAGGDQRENTDAFWSATPSVGVCTPTAVGGS